MSYSENGVLPQTKEHNQQHWRSHRQGIQVSLFLIFILLIAGCGSPSPTEEGSDAEAETTNATSIAAAVEATVEVAVEATVGSISTDGSQSSSNATSSTTADAAVDDSVEGDDGAPLIPQLTEQEQQVAQWVTDNTRHYIGDPNAPVVLIEFSDFQ